ncbi:MAG: ribulose-phosphate 3-epimerase [Actinomycetota bacterium]
MSEPAIVASVLGADYANLGKEVAELEAAGVDRIQWDVMDGRFVPNLTFGADVVAACRPYTELPFEAHLMVDEPDRWIEPFAEAGCDTVIVHQEACPHLHRTLSLIRALDVRAGVALNPATPIDCVRHVLDMVDLLVVMTVNPGFGGQSYIAAMEKKVAEARDLIDRSGFGTTIEVDGGISVATAAGAEKAGAEFLVAGSAILGHAEGKRAAVAELRRCLERPRRPIRTPEPLGSAG